MNRRVLVVGVVLAPFCASGVDAKKRKKKGKRTKDRPVSGDTGLRALMADIATYSIHGMEDEGRTVAELAEMIEGGDTVHLRCGFVSAVAVHMAEQAGYDARLVGCVTRDPFNGVDDGHVMVEVWDAGRWNLYDLSTNRRAVSRDGSGVGIEAQVYAGASRRWDVLADDALVDAAFVDAYGMGGFGDIAAWHQHIMGTPIIHTGARWVFADDADWQRMTDLGYVFVSKPEWKGLQEQP